MRTIALALTAIALLSPAPALAWGKTGHRVVAALADRHLSPEARKSIVAILGAETMAEAANWPDFMRSDPDPFWQKTANPWHYVTVPDGKSYDEVGAPPEGDAVTALKQFGETIHDPKASLADKQLALRFIIHIVGDLQQPLHAGNGRDHRGHDVKVTFFGKPTELHVVWDEDLIDFQQLSYSEWIDWLDAKITPEQAKDWCDTRPQTWIAEDVTVRGQIYPEKPDLSYAYVFAHKAKVEQRLSAGGIRLACVLNEIFGPVKR